MNHGFNYAMQMAEQARRDVQRGEIHLVHQPRAPGDPRIRLRDKNGPIEWTTVTQPKYELGRLHAYAQQAVKEAVTEQEKAEASSILSQCRNWETNTLGPFDRTFLSAFTRGKDSVRREHNWSWDCRDWNISDA